MVFGRSSDQGNSSNINFFHGLRDCDIDLRNCVFERVEVADNVVDLVDVLLGEVFLIGCEVARKDTGVDLCES